MVTHFAKTAQTNKNATPFFVTSFICPTENNESKLYPSIHNIPFTSC